LAERGDISAHISAISFSNVYYLLKKWRGAQVAHKAMVGMRDLFTAVARDMHLRNTTARKCDAKAALPNQPSGGNRTHNIRFTVEAA
jgi:hypothetical protein